MLFGPKIKDLMSSPAIAALASDTLYRAADLLDEHRIGQLPVIAPSGELLGVLHADEVRRALESSPFAYVGEVLSDRGEAIHPGASVRQALKRMREREVEVLAVVEHGRVVGFIT